jgi:hypothetical protein
MRRGRIVAPVVTSLAILALGAGAASGSVTDRKTKPEKPCKLLTTSEIETQFGGPLTKVDSDPSSKDDCGYEVAPNTLSSQGGTLIIRLVYPSRDPGALGVDALDSVAKQKEFDIQTQPIVDITGVGAAAYLNDFNVTLTFAKNKKRAYSIQWADNDISRFGLPTPQPIVDRLEALALEILR